jgi:serine phosphatase RsbU (regulator of sigma subunit)/anti-sigma regulatory factor (Ser/Thr protein kinase)
MGFANAFGGVLLLAVWICYMTGAFYASKQIMPLINTLFPISIIILLTPLLYNFRFKHILRKPNYKYFVVFSFVLVIAALNVMLPRNSFIAWALCIIMTNHYYNPKLGRITFGVISILMLLCLFLSLFVGEYDANLLGIKEVVNGDAVEVFGVKERYDLLHEQLVAGQNRYLQAFMFTFLPRALLLALIFIVSNSLNIRTYKLLKQEISVNSEQEKTRTELDVAKEIQMATLPTEFVTSEDIEIQAELKAAKSVGGDFYDYFLLDNEHVALVIADVSGKGIPAAMFMMKTITCFRNCVSLHKTPEEVLKEVNRIINKGNDSNMFVTCFYAVINTKTGEMNFANAGHNPPIVGQKQDYHYLKCKPGFVLGPLKDVFVTNETYQLKNGDTLTLYTDGITEARNSKGLFYGEDRLIAVFNAKKYSCLLELHHTLKDDIERFVDGEDQADDMTYITMKYHGDRYLYREETFRGEKENLPKMIGLIEDFAHEMKIEEGFIGKLCVVADEMLSNILKYGYAEVTDAIFIRLLYNEDENEFVMTLIDRAEKFDPFTVNNKPIDGNYAKRAEGGLGILIVKNLMSEYAYDYINHKNIVTLKKKF